MTVQWIASRLQMGTRNTLRNALLDATGEVFKIPEEGQARSMRGEGAGGIEEKPILSKPAAPSWADSQGGFEPGWD